jgi:hypothetical protein
MSTSKSKNVAFVLRHSMSLSGGFASRQYVASCYGSLHPNHWSLTSPGLVPATLAALPPTRAAPARACSSFACQAVALAKAGASSFVCPLLLCPSCRKQPPARSRSMSFAATPRFRSSDRPNENKISRRWRVRAWPATDVFS